MIPRSRGFLALLLGLLTVNLVLAFATGGPAERQRVPYQPVFVDQLGAGNVREISSREDRSRVCSSARPPTTRRARRRR